MPGLLGFTNVGYHWHKRSWKPLAVSLRGRTVVVTGATSGLGQAAASQLAELGARVILVGRNPDKAEATRREIVAATGNDNVAVALADLSLLADVRKLAQQLLDTEPRIHVLVNNAGVLLNQRTTTAEGNETTLATNLLAPYLLTQMLLPRLRESAPSRIINVSSGGMYATGLALDDLQYEKGDLRRQPRLCPHQARARHADRDVGGATEGQRRGRPCDASGLGGHAGCRRFAPGISRDHPALPAHGGAGRGYHHLACGRAGSRQGHRPVLARPRAAHHPRLPRHRSVAAGAAGIAGGAGKTDFKGDSNHEANKTKAPAIDIGISGGERTKIVKGLSALLADSYTLYLMTHNFHWNVTGPHFNSLHLMFMGQYTEQWTALDVIAERIRALGHPAPGTYKEFVQLASIKEVQRAAHGWQLLTAERGWLVDRFDAVLLATPAPQAAALLRQPAPELAARAGSANMRGGWALMLRFAASAERPFDGAFVNEGPLRWIARNNSKPGRGGRETWLLHATAEWSEAHLDRNANEIAASLLPAFSQLGGPTPQAWTAHRWRYADTEPPLDTGCAWEPDLGVGLCGDWLNGGKVEGAWLSGRALAQQVLQWFGSR